MNFIRHARRLAALALLAAVWPAPDAKCAPHPVPPAARLEAAQAARVSWRADPAKAGARPAWPDLDLTAAAAKAAGVAGPAAPLTAASQALLERLTALGDIGGAAGELALPRDLAKQPIAARAARPAWTAPALLADPGHAGDQYVGAAVCPTSGALYVVFESYDLASTDRDIHIARSADHGGTWTVFALPSFSQDEYMPDIAFDGAGYIHVVWARADGVVVRSRSAAPDNPQAWAFVRGLAVGSLCATPSIAVSGAGDFARVFIAASMVDSGEWTLLWMWSTTGGATLSYDYLPADGYPDLWPDVALDGANAYLINGEQDAYTGAVRILVARDAISGTFGNIVNLTGWTTMSCGFPSLAVQGQDVHCAYQLDFDDGAGNIDGDIIYAFSWDGLTSVYGPYEIAADTRETVGPSIFTHDGVVGILYLDAPAHGDEFGLVARLAGGQGHPQNWLTPESIVGNGTVSPSFRAAAGVIGLTPSVGSPCLQAAWTDKRDYPTQGLNIYGSRRTMRPNLAAFTPAGWGGPLVASLERGGRTPGLLAAQDTTWVSLAFWNDGLAGTTQDVTARLTLDGLTVAAWLLPGGLPTATYATVEDWPLVIGAGAHDLALVLDPLDAIAEELETDNTETAELWLITGAPVLSVRPDHVVHVFPPLAPALRALADSPPLLTRSWLPVVSQELATAIGTAGPDQLLPVIVTPAAQVDLAALGDAVGGARKAAGDPRGARATVVSALKGHAARRGADLAAAHATLVARGWLTAPRQLWLAGQLAMQATPAAIAELAADPAVGRIWLDDQLSAPAGGPAAAAAAGPVALGGSSPPAVMGGAAPAAADKAIAWHLAKIGATGVWAQGYDGTGVVIGHLDTGVNYKHPDLAGKLWDGGASCPHHGWDFVGQDDDPLDGDTSSWHGTHTAGLLAGGGAGGTTTGVAPGARVMSVRCVPGLYQDLVDALQFALDHGANLISFSAGWAGASDALRASLRGTAESLLAAGIPWICAAGNGDNAGGHAALPRDIVSPGDCPDPWYGAGGHTAVIAVGATDQNDAVGSTSSRGPAAWNITTPAAYRDYPYPPGLIKPDLAAPGVAVTSTVGASGYATYNGTSMATPLVAGAAALILQARPLLTPVELAAVLEKGARDVAAVGRDSDSGAGRLDIPAALALLPDTSADAFWVRNLGPLPLRVRGVTWSSAWLSVSPRVAVIAPGDSARFIATFDPAALTTGTHYDEIVFSSNDPRPPRRLPAVAVLGGGVTGVPGDRSAPAVAPHLQGCPNPFNPRTVLRFALPRDGRARLVVYGVDGRRLRTLVDAPLPAGSHEAVWDGRDDAGHPLASGAYLARLEGPAGVNVTRKLLMVR